MPLPNFTSDYLYHISPTTTSTFRQEVWNDTVRQWFANLVCAQNNALANYNQLPHEYTDMSSELVPLKYLRPIPLTANQLFCLKDCLKKSFLSGWWVGLSAFRLGNVSVFLNTKARGDRVLIPIEITILLPRRGFGDEMDGSSRIVFSSFFPVIGTFYETHGGRTQEISAPVEFLLETERLFVLNKCNAALPIEFWIKD